MAWLRTNLIRLRRGLKWVLLAAAILVAGVWAGGKWTTFSTSFGSDGSDITAAGRHGGVVVVLGFGNADFHLGSDIYDGLLSPMQYWFDESPRWIWRMRYWSWRGGTSAIQIPYWLPACILAVATGGLFWLDRRSLQWKKAGCCPACGYSLAGLAANMPCPECGAHVPEEKAPPSPPGGGGSTASQRPR